MTVEAVSSEAEKSAVDTRPHEAEADVRIPILEPGKQFKVLKEFSFTSSTEVIE